MKRTLLKILTGIVCLTGMYFCAQTEKENLMDLALDNIEALAQGENTNFLCYGEGDIDCSGIKVKTRFDGLR
ncbi:NVEALA domain-containing protein [Parabacteroides johnsonii]|uniref:NVEALA domain-containing protein n=1 Tax=Parabacteroides johnsonii TaxID=387661 RepID=UPI0018982009|nr:NVEALA domain-containing protein [Parabacteroides johnsonii]